MSFFLPLNDATATPGPPKQAAASPSRRARSRDLSSLGRSSRRTFGISSLEGLFRLAAAEEAETARALVEGEDEDGSLDIAFVPGEAPRRREGGWFNG